MNSKEVDKLSAQFSISVNKAVDVVSSWLDDSDSEDSSSNVQEAVDDKNKSIQPVDNPRAGLGSTKKINRYERPDSFSSKALDSLKRSKDKAKHKENVRAKETKLAKQETQQQDDSDSEDEGRSSISSKRSGAGTFLDDYRKKKRK
uniref:ARAD1B24277p n=1 Tax=Blastobotrys adeninivorans TaxID=409370 RepID=A0A060T7J4_BLAAD